MRYKAIVAYDGTDYAGWQIQPHEPTISKILQDSFYHTFKKQIKIIGASRTDAGVHALAQVIMFDVDLDIDPARMQKVWNDDLPQTILLRSLAVTDSGFHPQKNVQQKTYWYHFFLKKPLPMMARYGFFFPYAIDEEKLRAALAIFKGQHDFRSFCTGYEQENTLRIIDDISLQHFKRYNLYRIEVKGQRFLHHMIRRIVGASLMVASRHTLLPSHLEKIIEEKNPEQELLNAPAHGLMLYKINYKH